MNNNSRIYTENLNRNPENSEQPYIVISDKQLKKKKRKNRIVSSLTFCLFIIVGYMIFYMYRIDKYEFYINKSEVLIANKSSYQIEITPKNSEVFDYKKYTYKSRNEDIAIVDETGKVTAVGVGETEIEIKYKNGYESKKIKVKIEDTDNIEISSTYEDGKIETEVPGREELEIDVTYESATGTEIKIDSYGHVENPTGEGGKVVVYPPNGLATEVEIPSEPVIVDVERIELVENNITIKKGGKAKITARVLPDNSSNKSVSYISNNENVKVDNEGNIIGINKGRSIITVSSNNGKIAYCNVDVIEESVLVKAIDLNPKEVEIYIGESKEIGAKIVPSNATDRELIWESKNTGVVSVENGKITGVGIGEAEVIVSTQDGRISENCKVKVKNKIKEVDELRLKEREIDLKLGSKYKLQVETIPSNATNQKLTYTSNNQNVIVDATGLITAKNVGTSVITIKSANGKMVTCKVNITEVVVEVNSISLDSKEIIIKKDEKKQIIATVLPSNATDREITWQSSNRSVATVNNGVITGVGNGNAVITATSKNGKNASVKVTVIVPVESIRITGEDRIKVGGTTTYKAEIKPTYASDKKVIWTSSNSSVATIDKNGKITGKKAGTAKIIATTSGGMTASKTIILEEIEIPVDSITLSPNTITLELGHKETATLSVIYLPNNAVGQSIKTWKSSNPSVAQVDSNGMVVAKGVGETTITAISLNGKKASCKVNVNPNSSIPTGIKINHTGTEELDVGENLTLKATLTPSTATDTLTWTSSKTSVATVNSMGKVTAKSAGTTIITVKTSNNLKAELIIKVNKIKPTSVSLNLTDKTLNIGETIKLNANVQPSDVITNLTWTSSNKDIAIVDSNGKVTAKGVGTASITVKTNNGKTATCKITVLDKIQVHFINIMENNNRSIGKYDAIFIKIGNKSIMIDGGFYMYADKVIQYIKNLGVNKIDYYVGSHGHGDHISAAGPIIKEFNIKNIIVPSITTNQVNDTNERYHSNYTVNMMLNKTKLGGEEQKVSKDIINQQFNAIKNCKIIEYDSSNGIQKFNVNGAVFSVLGPTEPNSLDIDWTNGHNVNNRGSLILRMDYGNTSFLFSGDAGDGHNKSANKEYYVIRDKFGQEVLDVDVYKNGHHYSNKYYDEPGRDGIEYRVAYIVKPKYTIMITGGVCSDYPSLKYLQTLKDVGSKIYIIGIKNKCSQTGGGTVIVNSNGKKIDVKQLEK